MEIDHRGRSENKCSKVLQHSCNAQNVPASPIQFALTNAFKQNINDSCINADSAALVVFPMQLCSNNNNSMHHVSCALESIPTLTGKQRAEKMRGIGSVGQIMVCFCRVVADNVIVWVCLMFACQRLDSVASTEERDGATD